MKQLRKLLLVMFTSILVMASSSATANQNNSNDLDLIFGTSATQSIELASLSDAEMVATEGECGGICTAIAMGVGVGLVLILADRYINRLLDNLGW